MNDNFGGPIPTDDWDTYAHVSDLPLYLWASLREKIDKEERQRREEGIVDFTVDIMKGSPRLEFALLDENLTLDPRLVARLYRGWWARVFFPSEMGVPLRYFVSKATEFWPNRTHGGVKRELKSLNLDGKKSKNPHHVSLARFFEALPKKDEGILDPFERLRRHWINEDIHVEDLRRVEEKSVDRLIEYGDTPQEFRSMLAALVFAFIQNPQKQPGILMLLNDLYLPDFTDVSKAQTDYDGRLHFVKRTDAEKSKKLSAERSDRTSTSPR